MNSYGLTHFWQQGDFVTRFVALVLLVMSVVTWIVIAYKAIQFWRVRQNARSISTRFWHNKNFCRRRSISWVRPNQTICFVLWLLEGLQSVEHHHSSQDDLHGVLSLSDCPIVACAAHWTMRRHTWARVCRYLPPSVVLRPLSACSGRFGGFTTLC